MKLFRTTLAITVTTAMMNMAYAGGLERSTQSVDAIFEKGNYAELSYAQVTPNMEAVDGFGSDASKMLETYGMAGAAVKINPSEDTALALFYSQPWGVSTTYPTTSSMFNNQLGATQAQLKSEALGLVASNKVAKNLTVYTGIEYQTISGLVKAAKPLGLEAALANQDAITSGVTNQVVAGYVQAGALPNPAAFGTLMTTPENLLSPQQIGLRDQITGKISENVTNEVTNLAMSDTLYELDLDKDQAFTPMIGIAYEKPEIALRASATYRAPVPFDLVMKERTTSVAGQSPLSVGKSKVNLPQSVTLNLQTGLSEKHQLLGKVNARWVDWSKFKVEAPVFTAQTGEPLASYDHDSYALEVGLAKRFTPKLAAEVSVAFDATGDEEVPLSLLGPNGPVTSIGVGAQYDVTDGLSVSGGAQYLMIKGGVVPGDDADSPLLKVSDSDGYAVGMKLAYKF